MIAILIFSLKVIVSIVLVMLPAVIFLLLNKKHF